MNRRLVLGIAGGTGSGKTTIATAIKDAIGPSAVVIDHDSYYRDRADLSFDDRAKINFDHPDSLDNELLLQHIEALRAGQRIAKPIYDFKTHLRRKETEAIEPAPVIIVEGILTLAIPRLRAAMDIKIFVDTAADIRLVRRIRRDLEQRGRSFESIRSQYYRTVRPMHLAFVEPSKRFADVIIPEGGESSETGQRAPSDIGGGPGESKIVGNRIAIDLLVGRIRYFLARETKA